MTDSYFWIRQRNLEYKSRLQRSNEGCPWPAHILAIVKAAKLSTSRSEAVISEFKRQRGFSDEDIMDLLSCYENKDWNNEKINCLLLKKRSL